MYLQSSYQHLSTRPKLELLCQNAQPLPHDLRTEISQCQMAGQNTWHWSDHPGWHVERVHLCWCSPNCDGPCLGHEAQMKRKARKARESSVSTESHAVNSAKYIERHYRDEILPKRILYGWGEDKRTLPRRSEGAMQRQADGLPRELWHRTQGLGRGSPRTSHLGVARSGKAPLPLSSSASREAQNEREARKAQASSVSTESQSKSVKYIEETSGLICVDDVKMA